MRLLSAELRAAIDNAYRVFGRYPRPAHIDVCEQCYPEMPKWFAEKALREIDAGLLTQYHDARSCHGYSPNMDDDMRYLLPRWLELIAQGEEIGRWGDEDGLRVVMPAEWRARWPAEEAAALDRVFTALFDDAMRTPLRLGDGGRLRAVRGRDFSWFLSTIGYAGSGAAFRVLERHGGAPGRDLDLRIASLANHVASDSLYGWARKRDEGSDELFNPALAVLRTDEEMLASCDCDRCQQEAAAWEWLANPVFRERLEAAVLVEGDPDWAQVLSFGEQIIGALVRNRAEVPGPRRSDQWRRFRETMAAPAVLDRMTRVPTIETGILHFAKRLSHEFGSEAIDKVLAYVGALDGHNADTQIAALARSVFPLAVDLFEATPEAALEITLDLAEAKQRWPAIVNWLANPELLLRMQAAKAREVLNRDKVLFEVAERIIIGLMRDRANQQPHS